jgi:hypothetical protein
VARRGTRDHGSAEACRRGNVLHSIEDPRCPLLDPPHLDTEAAYLAALDELEALMATDPDTPAGRRCDELLALIEAYEARNSPCEIPLQ